MKQYIDLLKNIKENGKLKSNRTDTETVGIFGHMIKFDLEKGLPILTTKKLSFKSIAIELLWFLGNHTTDENYKDLLCTNIKFLTDNKVTIWDEWADEHGDLGKVYGYQWTKWEKYVNGKIEYINQIDNIVKSLRVNPNDRRMICMAWNPAQLDEMNLPPCHYSFQVNSEYMSISERKEAYQVYCKNNELKYDELYAEIEMTKINFPTRKLNLMWNQRSVDTFLGLPYNITSYALLLQMLAHVTNHSVGVLTGSLGDTHLYVNHMEYVDQQILRTPSELPIVILNKNIKEINDFRYEDFKLINYNAEPNWKNIPIAI